MRKYVFFICLLLLILLTTAFTNEVQKSLSLFGRFIILDPGHGGLDPGSVYKDEYEKDYNLDFSKYLKYELESRGATVIMTRAGDYDLSSPNATRRKKSDFDNRIKLINEDNPDIYISLHMNYLGETKYYGSQAFYSSVNDSNEILASILQKQFNDYFKSDRKYNKISNDKYMYSKLKPTGVLIEFGFLSSPTDRKNLKSEKYKRELAQIICDGIVDYFTEISSFHNTNYS